MEPSLSRSPGSAKTVNTLRDSASTCGATVEEVVGVTAWPTTQTRKFR